jgi:uncharacterized protein
MPPGVKPVAWDGMTAEGWGPLADGAGAIVNLAGENLAAGRWTKARKARIWQSRMNAGRAVVEATRQAEAKPQVIVQASGVGYYGPRGDEPIDESEPAGTGFEADLARAWEPSTAAVEEWGVRRVIIRSAAVLSMQGGALPPMVLPYRLFVGGRHGSGRQWLSWIHLADEVEAIKYLIVHPEARGPYNLSAPEPLPNREFVRTLGQVLRRPSWFPVPAFVFHILFGQMASVLLDGRRAVPQRLEALGYRFRLPTALAALQDLLR